MRRCTACGKRKKLDKFYRSTHWKSGYHPYCKRCSIERATQWAKENPKKRKETRLARYHKIREYIVEQKKQPCTKCGGCFPTAAMHFHHIRGTKKFKIGGRGSYSLATVKAEIAKCVLVCANCHAVEHA